MPSQVMECDRYYPILHAFGKVTPSVHITALLQIVLDLEEPFGSAFQKRHVFAERKSNKSFPDSLVLFAVELWNYG